MEPTRRFSSAVYHALLAGMIISTSLFGLAVLLQLAHAAHLAAYDPVLLLKIGTVAMVLTPISRVVVSIIGFAAERDYAFVAVTVIVLVIIAASVLLGLTGVEVRG